MEQYANALLELGMLELELSQKAFDESNEAGPDETGKRYTVAQHLRRVRLPLLQLLAEFRPIPDRDDTSCSCANTGHNSLPEVLAEQTVDLSDLLAQAIARRARAWIET